MIILIQQFGGMKCQFLEHVTQYVLNCFSFKTLIGCQVATDLLILVTYDSLIYGNIGIIPNI